MPDRVMRTDVLVTHAFDLCFLMIIRVNPDGGGPIVHNACANRAAASSRDWTEHAQISCALVDSCCSHGSLQWLHIKHRGIQSWQESI